jgi:hypothetical protein
VCRRWVSAWNLECWNDQDGGQIRRNSLMLGNSKFHLPLGKKCSKTLEVRQFSATQLKKMDCTAAVTKAPNRQIIVNSITK